MGLQKAQNGHRCLRHRLKNQNEQSFILDRHSYSDRRTLFILILIMIARRRARALSRVASGSRPAPGTPLKQRAVERALRSDQSGHARGRITRGEALICTTDECHSAKSAAL